MLLILFFIANTLAAHDLNKGNEIVANYLESTELARVKTYCIPEKDDCRTLYQRKNKKTGELTKSFYDKFTSRERGAESVCYVIFNEETNKFEVFSDLTPDGIVEIDQHLPQNKSVSVTFDENFYPTAENIVLSRLGTKVGLKGTMKFTSKLSFIDGHVVPLDNIDDLGQRVKIKYLSISEEF